MAITSVRSFEEDLAAIVAAGRTTIDTARTALGRSSTRAILSNARSTAEGIRGDISDARNDLDATDIRTLALYETGEGIIALWAWERAVRKQLVALDARFRVLQAMLALRLDATPEVVYIVRSGDTLQSIAAKMLGDWKEWTRLAEVNGLTPGALTAGSTLRIPARR